MKLLLSGVIKICMGTGNAFFCIFTWSVLEATTF